MHGLDLQRATDHGKVAGVCAGVADRWHVDPLVVRMAAVLLALCAGVGAVLYGAAWALLPGKGEEHGPLQRKLPAAQQVPLAVWIVITAAIAILVMAITGPILPISSTPVVILAAVWYFGFFRPSRRRRRAEEAADTAPTAAAPPADPAYPEPSGWADQLPPVAPASMPPHATAWQAASDRIAPTPPAPPAPPRRQTGPAARKLRSRGLLVAAAAVILLGIVNAVGWAHVPFAAFTAVALLVIGVTIALSAWTGRPRGLLPLGIVLLSATLLGAMATRAASESPWDEASDSGTIDRSYTSLAELPDTDRVDIGSVRVDLSDLVVTEDRDYSVRVDAGTVVVVLPRQANVTVDARTDSGMVTVLDTRRSGIDLHLEQDLVTRAGAPVLHITIRVDVGTIEVRQS